MGSKWRTNVIDHGLDLLTFEFSARLDGVAEQYLCKLRGVTSPLIVYTYPFLNPDLPLFQADALLAGAAPYPSGYAVEPDS